jgi:hypothetical protein
MGSDNGSKELLLIVMGALEKIEPPFSSIPQGLDLDFLCLIDYYPVGIPAQYGCIDCTNIFIHVFQCCKLASNKCSSLLGILDPFPVPRLRNKIQASCPSFDIC